MKIKHLLVAAVMLITSTAAVLAQGMQIPPVPVDPAVRIGKLPNGLTYYIRQNGYPEHRANFYIAQRVGSIQEEESQRGLAHFLEHMAFNGSDNFPGNNLIEYLRSIGVEFGRDLNAYTAVDQTVYNINNVPTNNIAALDSCLLILKDWSNGLTLDPEEIDKERGVINNEWRLRSSAIQRMLERNLETLYPGSKYGRRMPIGLMEVVNNFKPEVLRQYYEKWYRPDNQAIIVVGDIDVDRTEAKIKEMFSNIPLQPNAAQVVDEEVPDNNEAIIIVDKDKEQRVDLVQVMFKHDVMPDSIKGTIAYLLQQYGVSLSTQMLNARLGELSQQADCPYNQAFVEDGDYIYASTKGAFTLLCVPKPGQTEAAVAASLREVMRAAKFGFTESEYARAKADYLSELEKTYTNREKRDNDVYGRLYAQNFTDCEPIPSIEDEFSFIQQMSPVIPVQAINEMLASLVSVTDTNLVVFSVHPESETAVYPTAASLKAAIDGVHAEQLEAWVDNVKNEPLIAQMPAKGQIVSEKDNATLGYKELTLSNGARVLLKKTDFQADEVLLSATSKGGSSLLGEEDFINAKVFDMVISYSGLGNFSSTELQKALAGKQANADLTMDETTESVSGKSTPKDVETMLQMAYLYFTDIKKDENSFNSLMELLRTSLKNKATSPDMAYSDSVSCTLFMHNPRFTSIEIEDLDKVDYDRILQIAKERTANAADFTFTIVGNYDEATIRPLIEQYIASLPANGEKENWKKVSTYVRGEVENKFIRKMETPKAQAYMSWYNLDVPYSLENDIYARTAAQVLEMIYMKKIREDAGAAYSAGAYGQSRIGGDTPFTVITGVCPMDPTKSDLALQIMQEEVKNLGNTVDADMLNKVKELMLKRVDDNAKTNSYWTNAIYVLDEYGIDRVTEYKNIVNSITPEKVAKFVKDVILGGGNNVRIIMLPESAN